MIVPRKITALIATSIARKTLFCMMSEEFVKWNDDDEYVNLTIR